MSQINLCAIKNILVITFLSGISAFLYSFDLEDGKSRNLTEKSLLKDIYSKHKTLPGYLFEYENNKYYALSKTGNAIGIYDMTDSQSTLSGWPLTRWPHEPIEQAVIDIYEKYSGSFFSSYNTYIKHRMGCYHVSPLRYGDIDNDGVDELVLFLGKDMIVFSPDYGRIVFSMSLSTDDWMSEADTVNYFGPDGFGGYGWDTVPVYQWTGVSDLREPIQAYRGHAKVFQGDFDEDGNFDLIVWRKLYQSPWVGDGVTGFNFVSDTFYFYEKDLEAQENSDSGITGEYLPQETDEATVQSWLTDNDLTWSKGYPSVSECEGEEGELIPEMHDPLLNDPDVLQ
jgi:hypothetical protein